MTKEPLFTIVIPVYNAGDLLHRTLRSVLNQTEPSWELYCVDDGSMDNSVEIIQHYVAKDVRIHYWPFDGDKSMHPRQRPLQAARGRYVYFCDHDDCMHPKLLAYARWALEEQGADFFSFYGFTNRTREVPPFEELPDFGEIPCLRTDSPYRYLQPGCEWVLQIVFWLFVTRIEYARRATFTYGMELPIVLEILEYVRSPLITHSHLYAYSVLGDSMAHSPLKLSYARTCCNDLRRSCELFDYGRKGSPETWAYVRKSSIGRNLKYYMNWCRRSKRTLSPEEYAACARYLANELAFFRKMKCLTLRDNGWHRYFRILWFILRWGGKSDD